MRGNPLRYVAVALAGVVLLLGAAAAIVTAADALGRPQPTEDLLLEYQMDKLAAARADIAFVGDSSLGNAIDAEVWQALTGDRAVNLALTGGFGLSGTINMAERLLARPEPPARLVVMQTADIFMRPVSRIGDLTTKAPAALPLLDRIDLFMQQRLNHRTVYSAIQWLAANLAGTPAPPQQQLGNDYIAQRDPLPAVPAASTLMDYEIDPAAGALLGRLARACTTAGVDCTYVHGPLVDPLCRGDGDYFVRVDAMVRGAGLQLAGETPLCIDPADIGDAADHVVPARKAEYTARFVELLEDSE